MCVCVSEEYISLSLCSTNNTLGLIPAIQKARFKKEIKIYVHNLAYDKKIFCDLFSFAMFPQANLKFMGLSSQSASGSN